MKNGSNASLAAAVLVAGSLSALALSRGAAIESAGAAGLDYRHDSTGHRATRTGRRYDHPAGPPINVAPAMTRPLPTFCSEKPVQRSLYSCYLFWGSGFRKGAHHLSGLGIRFIPTPDIVVPFISGRPFPMSLL